jgi:hypothetical protein
MWDPQRLTTLWVSMACYRDSFTFYQKVVADNIKWQIWGYEGLVNSKLQYGNCLSIQYCEEKIQCAVMAFI